MSTEAAENEPSMEEILASIRRIIDEDEEGGETEAEAAAPEAEPEAAAEPENEPEPEPEPVAEAAPEPAPEPEPEAESEEEVLELTDTVEDDSPGTDPLAIDDDLMIVDREDEPEAEAQPEPEPEPEPEPVMEAAAEPESDETLVSPPAATAAAGAFDALAENLRVASADGLTLEGIVREMMRPMLKEWLDANLPRIVEEKVESEIERISRRR